jgi:hypothetical protein
VGRERAPRKEIGDVVETDHILSEIGLISKRRRVVRGARDISSKRRFEEMEGVGATPILRDRLAVRW